MIDFLVGLAVGTAFAPFWMMVWNTFVKPTAMKIWAKVSTSTTPPTPPAAK